jgi:hypothetical protein
MAAVMATQPMIIPGTSPILGDSRARHVHHRSFGLMVFYL